MSIAKSLSNSGNGQKRPANGRRSFIWKAGAAMSAVAASAVTGFSKSGKDADAGLKNRIGMLEDANTIRKLHQIYESYLDRGMYEEVVDMFADNGEVIFHGDVFSGKNSGIRRLYCSQFRQGRTGKKMAPAPQMDPEQQHDIVEVALDRKSALGQFPYSIQVGTPMTGDSSLVRMARLQGEGIVKRLEGGIHEVSYVKVGDSWKISRLEYRAV